MGPGRVTSSADLNLESRATVSDPAGYFADAQGREGPVQWADAQRGWAVLSHAEVTEAFRDGERLSADRIEPLERAASEHPARFGQVVDLLRGWMIFRDPPAHTRLREPVRAAFTPRRVASLEGEIQQIVDDVLEDLDGEVDFTADVAKPIPALVIAALLGVDPDDRTRFQGWSDDLAAIVFSTRPSKAPDESVVRAADEFTRYFSALIERERARPSGSLLGAIANLDHSDLDHSDLDHSDLDHSDLDHMELVGACTMLLFAGHETTTNLLNNTMGVLLERPELMAWMRTHPEADTTAVDEFLRVHGPARTMVRKAKVTHDRGGRGLEAGQRVFLSIVAANHDQAMFSDPGRLDLARDPNPHLGFGWGLHHCVGAHLARLEARLALRSLLDRFPHIEPVGEVPSVSVTTVGIGRGPVRVRLGR